MKKTTIVLLLTACLSFSAESQTLATLSGQITDAASRPVPNASVHIINTQIGATADAGGRFTLSGLPEGTYTLQVSAIGFAGILKEVTLQGTDNNLSFTLIPATRELDAVLVSAQKKEEGLQKVPFSVSALDASQVTNYRLWNSRDITAIVPNLYSADPGDNRLVTSVRGVTTTSYDPAVATYIDGVNQFGLDTYIAQLFDVERIEVLRGPQGTLYGRNAMGGVINIITRQPDNRTTGFAEASFGNYGQQRYGLGLRTPIVKDKLFIGVSGLYDRRKGFYTNEFNNKDFDRQHSAMGNYYLHYRVNPRWSATLNFKHVNNRNDGTFTLVNGVEEALNNPFKLNQDAVTELIDNTLNSSLSINHTGRYFNFSSQTAYQTNHRHYADPIDGDFSPIDGISIINNYGKDWNTVKVWTQEFRFTSPAASRSPIKWTAGTYLFAQNNPVKQATRFGEDAQWVTGQPGSNYSIINTSKGKSKGIAVYGQATWSITDRFDITAGLRYDYEHKKQDVLSEYQMDPDPNPQFALVPDTGTTASYNAVSPKLSLAYHLNNRQQLYAVYSRGYRAGGLTQIGADPSQPPLYAYKPEYSNNIEVGFKNELLQNRLRLNIAAFYTTINDAQVPTLVLPDAITITRNAGKLTSKGAELELAAMPFRGLKADYSLGYTHAEYTSLKVPQDGAEVNLKGNRQVFTPDMTSMLALQYEYGVSKAVKLVVRGEWAYIGEQYFDLANQIKQDPYSILNTRFGVSSKHADIMFWMRNITDEKYISYAYDFGAVHLGNPQTFGVTITGRL
jgi:Outer membrane receptor proteins, mostly Fe transport